MSLRILVCGNHTCGNRGDAAILRGLMNALEHEQPNAEFTITSRYPTSSTYLLGREVVSDFYAGNDIVGPGPRPHTRRRMVPWQLMAANRLPGQQAEALLPAGTRRRVDRLREYDLVVQLGGSYFLDLYGYSHFETGFSAVQAGVPWILLGHSIGPIASGRYPIFIRHLMNRADYIGLRETISRDLLASADMPMKNVAMGADTAWNVDTTQVRDIDAGALFAGDGRPIIAITARALAPFDALLGTTQAAYEAAFGALVNELIRAGYAVLALSTCTGIDSYHRDDRMVALRIGAYVDDTRYYHVVMDELDDLQLGAHLRACRLLIATRLHSAIIAMNFGTPALTLAYEHKSKGILHDMQLDSLHVDIEELLNGSLFGRVLPAAEQPAPLVETMTPAVDAARASARAMVADGLKAAGL